MIYLLLDGKLDSFNGKTEYSEGFIIGEDYIEDPNVNACRVTLLRRMPLLGNSI